MTASPARFHNGAPLSLVVNGGEGSCSSTASMHWNLALLEDDDVDTLFDERLTADMLTEIRAATRLRAQDIGSSINTHACRLHTALRAEHGRRVNQRAPKTIIPGEDLACPTRRSRAWRL